MERYDVLVIGGGIHGVGVAQAASARGYRVIVLEKERIAAGTSSRSSKLIHGGLRYLASGQLRLVRTSLREREILLRIAPRIVKRVPFFIPVYPSSRYGSFRLHAGLGLYSILSGFGEHSKFSRLDPEEFAELAGLSTQSLRSVYQYMDAQTDDVELTHAVMRSAKELGAELRCPALFVEAQRHNDHYRITFEDDDRGSVQCTASTVINATGPWINHVLEKCQPTASTYQMDLIQGTHLVLPYRMTRGVYYVESVDDRRPVFVMPWYENTLVGTTETKFEGDPARVAARPEESEYLLRTYRHYFPERMDEPISSFAGLRVLPRSNRSANARPRETVFLCDSRRAPRMVTIAGGKLTAYRATANRILGLLSKSLPTSEAIADTATLAI